MPDLSIAGPTFLPDKHCVSGGITTLFLGPTFLPRHAKYIADALRASSRSMTVCSPKLTGLSVIEKCFSLLNQSNGASNC